MTQRTRQASSGQATSISGLTNLRYTAVIPGGYLIVWYLTAPGSDDGGIFVGKLDAPGTFVDDGINTIIMPGSNGSLGWVRICRFNSEDLSGYVPLAGTLPSSPITGDLLASGSPNLGDGDAGRFGIGNFENLDLGFSGDIYMRDDAESAVAVLASEGAGSAFIVGPAALLNTAGSTETRLRAPNDITIYPGNSFQWRFNASGNIIPNGNGTQTIGDSTHALASVETNQIRSEISIAQNIAGTDYTTLTSTSQFWNFGTNDVEIGDGYITIPTQGTSVTAVNGQIRFGKIGSMRALNNAGSLELLLFDFISSTTGDLRIGPNSSPGGTNNNTYIRAYAGDVLLEQGGTIRFRSGSLYNQTALDLIPTVDNTNNLGGASNRYVDVFAVSGSVNSSDEREKTEILPIDDKVLDAWDDVHFVAYRWFDRVGTKGGKARVHFGAVAQQIAAAFEQRKLDGCRYGLLCYDEWENQFGPDDVAVAKAEKNYEQTRQRLVDEATAKLKLRRAMIAQTLDESKRVNAKRVADALAALTVAKAEKNYEQTHQHITMIAQILDESKRVNAKLEADALAALTAAKEETQLAIQSGLEPFIEKLREASKHTKLIRPAGNRWGLRYTECLVVEAAWQRRRVERIEQRLTKAGL